MELKDKLARLRKEKGMTQQDLAEALRVSRQTISRWEVGTSLPTLDNLARLSELYQVPLDDLAHDRIEKPDPAVPSPSPSASGSKLHVPHRYLALALLGLVLFAGAVGLHSINTSERGPIMDIIHSIRASSYRPVQSAAAQTARTAASSFAEQTKDYYGVSSPSSSGYRVILSPYLQLRMDYTHWKEAGPPQELPDSQGPTEENMAYLRERYVGPLTMFRKMEAIDTMFDMGIITREQRNAFYGTAEIKTWTAGQVELREGPLEDGPSTSFSALQAQQEAMLYRLSPLAKSETLDDLFSWLE